MFALSQIQFRDAFDIKKQRIKKIDVVFGDSSWFLDAQKPNNKYQKNI